MYEFKNLLHGIGGNVSDELTAVLLCDKLGWTYDEFLNTPLWFVKALVAKIQTENEHANKQAKKQKQYG